MNYREQQLRQMHKNQLAKLIANWNQERNILVNNANVKTLKQTEEQKKEIQKTLNDLVNLLGSSVSDCQKLLGDKTLKELVKENEELKNTDTNQKITNLENNLADTKGELKKIGREKESLLKIKTQLEGKVKSAGYQLDGLISSIEKGLVKDSKKEVLTSIKTIKSLLEDKK
jgi:hypothetical protein